MMGSALEPRRFSARYAVRRLTEQDVDSVYELAVGNPLYYQHCPPFVTRESIAADMRALPPRVTYADKSYVGFFEKRKLVAVMDAIANYPNEETVFVGFFMMNRAMQGAGIGSGIIEECGAYFRSAEYSFIRLGYAKGNPQSEGFWRKQGFTDTGIEYQNEGYTVVVLQKAL